MRTCPYCAEELRDEASECRRCERPLDTVSEDLPAAGGYEYRSEARIGGWPLVHVARGIDPQTGRLRVARGIIAVGNIALGVFAFGGMAVGVFSLGGVSLGLLAFGGLALGGVAAGGLAAAAFLALGGAAFALEYAIGGLAAAPHAIGPDGVDPELLELLQRWLPAPGS